MQSFHYADGNADGAERLLAGHYTFSTHSASGKSICTCSVPGSALGTGLLHGTRVNILQRRVREGPGRGDV